jgi:hypothetical protein
VNTPHSCISIEHNGYRCVQHSAHKTYTAATDCTADANKASANIHTVTHYCAHSCWKATPDQMLHAVITHTYAVELFK